MENQELFALIVSGCILIIGVIFKEALKHLIEKVFSTQSSKKIQFIYIYFIVIVTLGSAFTVYALVPLTDAENEHTETNETKSDMEKIAEDVEVGIEITENVFDFFRQNKKRRDSLKESRARWGLQIGNTWNRKVKEELADEYNRLKHIDTSLKIFKRKSNEFLIVFDLNLEQELNDSLITVLKKELEIEYLTNINLLAGCRLNQNIANVKGLNVRKRKVELPLIGCN